MRKNEYDSDLIIVKEDCTEAGKPGEVSGENSQVNKLITQTKL